MWILKLIKDIILLNVCIVPQVYPTAGKEHFEIAGKRHLKKKRQQQQQQCSMNVVCVNDRNEEKTKDKTEKK